MITSWSEVLEQKEFQKPYFKELSQQLYEDEKQYTIYPPKEDIFNAFKLCSFDKTRVVVLGQDPYFNEGQAMGLSFSVRKGVKIPPSLQNIYKELKSDLNISAPNYGDLSGWAQNGVLMLNNTLTVRKGSPNSHLDFGWSNFTNNIISLLNEEKKNLVFILWGKFAQSKVEYITDTSHFKICSPHPSPYSASSGFFGSKPFSKTNDFLLKTNQEPINWHSINEDNTATTT